MERGGKIREYASRTLEWEGVPASLRRLRINSTAPLETAPVNEGCMVYLGPLVYILEANFCDY